MRKTKYTVKPTTQFKKDYKLAIKRGLKTKLLEDVVSALAMGEPLPEKNKDHALSGNWTGHGDTLSANVSVTDQLKYFLRSNVSLKSKYFSNILLHCPIIQPLCCTSAVSFGIKTPTSQSLDFWSNF